MDGGEAAGRVGSCKLLRRCLVQGGAGLKKASLWKGGGGGPLEYKTRDEVISGKVNREKVSQGKGLKGSTKRGEEEEPEV